VTDKTYVTEETDAVEPVEQPKPTYAIDNPPTNSETVEVLKGGFAVKTVPDGHVGQVHLVGPDGSINNFVGPQVSPLVAFRDGGPYLDEGEVAREEYRRKHVMERTTVLNDVGGMSNQAAVAPNDSPTFQQLVSEQKGEPFKPQQASSETTEFSLPSDEELGLKKND
jgi:hypothetical protein